MLLFSKGFNRSLNVLRASFSAQQLALDLRVARFRNDPVDDLCEHGVTSHLLLENIDRVVFRTICEWCDPDQESAPCTTIYPALVTPFSVLACPQSWPLAALRVWVNCA
jgi:hypothetical protein